jgi:tryptophan-rich hypothetical protein
MTNVQPKPRLNPKKLLLSKWTAVTPVNKEKHFVVTQVLEPESPDDPIVFIEIEAVHSRRSATLAWRDLQDTGVWRQGWV